MTDKTDTREIVLDILLAVTRDGEYSHIALKNTLDKYQYLEKRERAFLTKVVEGTLEYQIRIDYIINTFSNTKVHKIPCRSSPCIFHSSGLSGFSFERLLCRNRLG